MVTPLIDIIVLIQHIVLGLVVQHIHPLVVKNKISSETNEINTYAEIIINQES